ncbi:MAG: hypothetical protein J6J90_01120 [Angelakisella sp.]|nr:hypothetical protein [Angelakisella sp.]
MSSRQYEDIIGLPRPVSRRHPPMARQERAAQFAPFAALAGHGAILREAARQTENRPALSEDAQTALDARLRLLVGRLEEHPTVTATYFLPDEKKAGGACVTVSGQVLRLREFPPALCLAGGAEIPLSALLALEGPLWEALPE